MTALIGLFRQDAREEDSFPQVTAPGGDPRAVSEAAAPHALRVLAVNPRAERLCTVSLGRGCGSLQLCCHSQEGWKQARTPLSDCDNSQSAPQPKMMVTPWESCQFCLQPNNECLPLMYSFPRQIASDHLLCASPVLGTEDASVCGTQKSLFLRSVLFLVQPTVSRSP